MVAGSRCRAQIPPARAPPRYTPNPGLAGFPWMLCKYPRRPHTACGARVAQRLRQQLPGLKTRRRALLALPFGGLPGSPRRAARWLCPQPLPPPPKADSRSRARWAPPPGTRPRPQASDPAPPRRRQPRWATLAQWGLCACCGCEVAVAAPAAATAVVVPATHASYRPGCPKMLRIGNDL